MALPQGFGPRRSYADAYRQQLANQLIAQGGDTSPVAHPLQGVARLAQALMGGYMTQRNEARENEQQQAFSQGITDAMQPRMVPGASGSGPRPDATMAPPSMGDVAQRLGANPATAHLAPQFQMMDLQQQAAEAAKRNDPMFGRVAVRGVGLVDMRGNKPQVVVPEQRPQNPSRFSVHNIGGRAVAIDQSDPTRRNDLGPYGSPAPEAPAGTTPAFQGTGMDAQAWNVLTNPQSDPSSPVYAAAHAHLTQPKLQMVPGTDGNPVMSLVTPRLPPNIRAPVFTQPGQAPAQSQPPAPPQGPQMPPQAPGAMPQPEAAPMPASQATPGSPTQPQTVQLPGASVTQIAPSRPKDLTETQARANLFGTQMREAEDILATVRVPSNSSILAWRNLPESAVNSVIPENDQKYFNALRLFAAGVLRKETGAAFTPNELLDVQSRYFPMPGDTAAVMAQKARNRQQVQEAMRAELPGGNFRGLLPPNQSGGADNDPLGIRGGR